MSRNPLCLIAEDDHGISEALRGLFLHWRWDVVVAFTVAAGLDALCRGQRCPDLILLDLSFPDGDGTEILREVRALKLPVKVAVSSAYPLTGDRAVVLDLKPDGVFPKPIDYAVFTAFVKACRDGAAT